MASQQHDDSDDSDGSFASARDTLTSNRPRAVTNKSNLTSNSQFSRGGRPVSGADSFQTARDDSFKSARGDSVQLSKKQGYGAKSQISQMDNESFVSAQSQFEPGRLDAKMSLNSSDIDSSRYKSAQLMSEVGHQNSVDSVSQVLPNNNHLTDQNLSAIQEDESENSLNRTTEIVQQLKRQERIDSKKSDKTGMKSQDGPVCAEGLENSGREMTSCVQSYHESQKNRQKTQVGLDQSTGHGMSSVQAKKITTKSRISTTKFRPETIKKKDNIFKKAWNAFTGTGMEQAISRNTAYQAKSIRNTRRSKGGLADALLADELKKSKTSAVPSGRTSINAPSEIESDPFDDLAYRRDDKQEYDELDDFEDEDLDEEKMRQTFADIKQDRFLAICYDSQNDDKLAKVWLWILVVVQCCLLFMSLWSLFSTPLKYMNMSLANPDYVLNKDWRSNTSLMPIRLLVQTVEGDRRNEEGGYEVGTSEFIPIFNLGPGSNYGAKAPYYLEAGQVQFMAVSYYANWLLIVMLIGGSWNLMLSIFLTIMFLRKMLHRWFLFTMTSSCVLYSAQWPLWQIIIFFGRFNDQKVTDYRHGGFVWFSLGVAVGMFCCALTVRFFSNKMLFTRAVAKLLQQSTSSIDLTKEELNSSVLSEGREENPFL